MERDINDITHKIIGCAMQVHSTLGNGFQEVIYQRALAIELRYAGLSFVREMEMPIFYRNEHIGTRRVDFFIADCVMLEIKAMEKIETLIKPRLSITWKLTILQMAYSSILVACPFNLSGSITKN